MPLLPKPKREQNQSRRNYCSHLPCLIASGSFGSQDNARVEHLRACDWLNAPQSERHCDPHHIRKGANSGTGTKPSDFRTVPFCRHAHDEYHQLGHDRFCEKYGLDVEAAILTINKEFERLHPLKTSRETTRLAPVGLKSIKVQCLCGHSHDIPANKVTRYGAGLRYRCIRTNELHVVRVA